MTNEEVVKDFGTWNVPTNWDDVTLKMFQDIMVMSEKNEGDEQKEEVDALDMIAVLTGKTREEINQLPEDFVVSIISHMSFLNEDISNVPPSNEATINGKKYKINILEKLKFGEYTDVCTVQKNDKFNYAAIFAIVCRQEGEKYNDDYIANTFDERLAMWEKAPIKKVMPLIGFFLALSMMPGGYLEDYLTTAEHQINQLLTDIDDSLKSGDGKKLSLKSRMKVWWKLRKLKKCMRQLS